MWTAISYVSSGVTLVAFLAAVAAWLYRRKMVQMERMIGSAAEADRAQLVANALEVFHVDASGLTKAQQYQLALEQVRGRQERYRLFVYLIIVVAILAAGVAVFAIVGESGSQDGRGSSSDMQDIQELIRRLDELQDDGNKEDAEHLKQTLRPFAKLEKLFAVYSLIAWVSPQQKRPYVIENDAFGDGDAFLLDCVGVGDGDEGVEMGQLIRCFSEPVTRFVPRAGEEVETTALVRSDEFWYRFKWHSIFGYEMDVFVNQGDTSLADRLASDGLEGAGPLPAYALSISNYGHSDESIELVVRAGSVDSLDNGAIVVDDDDVEIYFGDEYMMTGKELLRTIRLLCRELGVDRPDLASAAAEVQTRLLRQTPQSIGRLTNAIESDSGIGRVLDAL